MRRREESYFGWHNKYYIPELAALVSARRLACHHGKRRLNRLDWKIRPSPVSAMRGCRAV